jgi:hypothetical protein
MKLLIQSAVLFIACLFSCYVYAQPGRPNIVKQPPRINGVMKATTNAATNAKIHANSNSVFGTGNGQSNYNKKNQSKGEEIKKEEETAKNIKPKKQKK